MTLAARAGLGLALLAASGLLLWLSVRWQLRHPEDQGRVVPGWRPRR